MILILSKLVNQNVLNGQQVKCTAAVENMSAMKLLNDGISADPDAIPTEVIEANINITTELLHKLFSRVWETEEISADWREAYLLKLPQRGEPAATIKELGIWKSKKDTF